MVLADLSGVRLGTASFRRALAAVSDDSLTGPSLLPGWTRKHIAAHVGYNARAISRLVVWAATGEETPMYASPQARQHEIDLGATLGPQALRSLCEHSAIELDVRWRDLPAERWHETVTTAQGRSVPVSETLWMRTREVWLHAVDLNSGTRLTDVPDAVQRRLLDDVVGLWSRRDPVDGWRLRELGGCTQQWHAGVDSQREVMGSLSNLLGWATGRCHRDLSFTGSTPAPAPRWL